MQRHGLALQMILWCVRGLAPWNAEHGIFDEIWSVCEQQARFASFPLVRVATSPGNSWNMIYILENASWQLKNSWKSSFWNTIDIWQLNYLAQWIKFLSYSAKGLLQRLSDSAPKMLLISNVSFKFLSHLLPFIVKKLPEVHVSTLICMHLYTSQYLRKLSSMMTKYLIICQVSWWHWTCIPIS